MKNHLQLRLKRRNIVFSMSPTIIIVLFVIPLIYVPRIKSDTSSDDPRQCPARCDMLKEMDDLRLEVQNLRQLLNQESLLRMNLDQDIRSANGKIENIFSEIVWVNQTLSDKNVETKDAVFQEMADLYQKVNDLKQTIQNSSIKIYEEITQGQKAITDLQGNLLDTLLLAKKINESIPKKGENVAFSATNARISSRDFVFRSVTLNIGNAYSSSTGTFTVPYTGVYAFFWTIASDGYNNCDSEISINNVGYHRSMAKSSLPNNHDSESQSLIRHCYKNDIVKIRGNNVRYSCHRIHADSSSFSGFRYI